MALYCPHVTIDRGSDRPVYRQLADLIRNRITSGELEPGSLLQSESALAQEHGIGRDAARRALAVLRGEGLIVTDHTGSHVRKLGERQTVRVPGGATITGRMPTDPERRQHGIGEGVPVFVVEVAGAVTLYPTDRYQLTT